MAQCAQTRVTDGQSPVPHGTHARKVGNVEKVNGLERHGAYLSKTKEDRNHKNTTSCTECQKRAWNRLTHRSQAAEETRSFAGKQEKCGSPH